MSSLVFESKRLVPERDKNSDLAFSAWPVRRRCFPNENLFSEVNRVLWAKRKVAPNNQMRKRSPGLIKIKIPGGWVDQFAEFIDVVMLVFVAETGITNEPVGGHQNGLKNICLLK